MNRKTNLFYLTGNDTNFLTFSNYTEYLTSVFLNTSYKMFMSKFLAFNLPFKTWQDIIDSDTEDERNAKNENNKYTIEEFKKYLMCYYENKLTILREHITTEDIMSQIHPLNYLLEAIHNFFEGNVQYEDMIKYKGDIVEQDYDGTYADSICIIDFNNYYDASIIYDSTYERTSDMLLSFNGSNIDLDHLYGWGNELDILGTLEPKYDVDDVINNERTCGYYSSSPLTLIESKLSSNSQITFNCIIPLFDIYAITEKELYDINHNELDIDISSDEDPLKNFKNVPYGIWITEHPITLYKDSNTGFGQSWSLVISSKFSPFPYGVKNVGDATADSVDKIEKYTYAQLLADQSKLYIQFKDALDKIQELQNRVNALNKSIESIATYSNIDDIREYLSKLDTIIDSKIDDQTKDMREMINNLKWKNIG